MTTPGDLGDRLWEGTASELQSLIQELTEELVEVRKLVFWLGPQGRLFGKREDGSWAEYSLPKEEPDAVR